MTSEVVPALHSIDPIELAENPWGYAKRLRFVLRAVSTEWPGRPPSSVSVLDIGCGNGSQMAIPLAQKGFQVIGVDPDERSIANAQALAPPNAQFHCGLLSSLTRRDNDVVILSEVLEHLTDPLALLREAIGYVAEAGIVIVTVPNGIGEFEIDNHIYRVCRLDRVIEPLRRHRASVSSSECQDGHLQFFRLRQLRRLFADANLRIVSKSASTLACGPLASYAFNWLPTGALTLNAKISDWLPLAWASGWYFVLRKSESLTDKRK